MSVSHDLPSDSKIRLTYQDYVQYPDDGNRHEIIDGDHYMNPGPVPYHQALLRHIHFQLYSAIELTNLGEVVFAPIDVQFSNYDVVQPDLVVVLKDNRIITTTKIKGVPDLVVEILSPSTASTDLTLKKQLYERAGVPEYWIADPDTKTIDQYILQGDRYNRAPAADPITTLANQLTIHHADIW